MLWLLPATLIMALALFYPLGHSLYTSFFELSLYDTSAQRFVGWENYVELLSSGVFWRSLQITGIFTVVSVAAEVVLGLAIALVVNSNLRGITVVRTVVLLPMMLTPIVLALIWKMMFNGEFGLINHLLGQIGLPPQQWLGDVQLALPSVIVVEVWQNTSYAVLIFLAALQGVPEELREAADVDGAGVWRTIWHIVLPFLRTAIVIVLIIRTLFAFRVFETIFALTGGGPADSTLIMSLFLQRTAFRSFDLGKASAIGWIMFVLALGISLLYLVLLRERRTRGAR